MDTLTGAHELILEGKVVHFSHPMMWPKSNPVRSHHLSSQLPILIRIIPFLPTQILVNGPSKLSQLPDKTQSATAAHTSAGAASGAAGYKSTQAQANQGFQSGYAAESSYSALSQYNQAYPAQGQGQYGQQGGAMYSQTPQTSQAPHVSSEMGEEYMFCNYRAVTVLISSVLPTSLLMFALTQLLSSSPLKPSSLPQNFLLGSTLSPYISPLILPLPPLLHSSLPPVQPTFVSYPLSVWSIRLPAVYDTFIRSVNPHAHFTPFLCSD